MKASDELQISAVVAKEKTLEELISCLEAQGFAPHDISIQEKSNIDDFKINKLKNYSENLYTSKSSDKKTPFMADDFGFVLGFAVALPFAIGMIIGAVIAGDLENNLKVLTSVGIGGVVGLGVGSLLAVKISSHRRKKIFMQEKQGGFIIWIHARTAEQLALAKKLLHQFSATKIKYQAA